MNAKSHRVESAVEALGWLHAAEGYALTRDGEPTDLSRQYNAAATIVLGTFTRTEAIYGIGCATRLNLTSVVDVLERLGTLL